MSGGEIGARINVQLSIMVGGDAAAFAKARPVLACMGHPERIVHVGAEPGVGNRFRRFAIRWRLVARWRA